ncbi:hypothetical protein [Veronia pacifica]|uniref:DUF1521 domain-containing protein n=1 Tax=Veronia pacifica TaxID=1080227 RepID=A0A1C3E9B2_9GAMM|nr:hypothetical protein [Veronia pacifica]ODA29816.1 hypothetical protein A8L45_21705 [Veronia pacifica]
MLSPINPYILVGQSGGLPHNMRAGGLPQTAVIATPVPLQQTAGVGGSFNAARFHAAQHFAQTQGLRFGIPCIQFPVFNHCGPFFPSHCGFIRPPLLPQCCPMPQFPGFGYGHGYNHGYQHGHNVGYNNGYHQGIIDAQHYRPWPGHCRPWPLPFPDDNFEGPLPGPRPHKLADTELIDGGGEGFNAKPDRGRWENENYRIDISEDGYRMNINNKNTGEKYSMHGDPILAVGDQKEGTKNIGLFNNGGVVRLDDGTEIHLSTTKGQTKFPHLKDVTIFDRHNNHAAQFKNIGNFSAWHRGPRRAI